MAKTALIIVDMVRDFTDPEGLVFYPENQKILPRIKKVLDESRKHELLIVFLQHCNRKDKVDKKAQSMRPNCIEGTFGIEIDPMLEVDEKKDYVIRKRKYSGFFGTDLDLVLRENEVENVVVVGTKTNCCIRATVTDAFYLNYNPYVIRECVATNSETVNEVHLTDIDKYLGKVIDMNTFSKMWGIKKPSEAKAIIEKQIADLNIGEPKNLEEQALKLAGTDVYEKLVKGYTEKQWGRPCTELPAFIIKRLPLRFIYDNNYFNDRFQGIPMGGYTQIIEKMLEGAEVKTDTDYFDFIKENPDIADKTVYTGMIDEFFGFQYGPLEYRSVRFETEVLDEENYQGNAVVNYTHRDVPYTRIIEHKHFEFGKQPKTVISREYSAEWKPGVEPYYPVNNDKNNALYEKYKELAETRKDVIFGGRLGQYKYYDMDKVIAAALECVEAEF